jgi:alpha 1,3-glucosidase
LLPSEIPRSVRFHAVEAAYHAPHPQGQTPPATWDSAASGEWQPLSIQQPIRSRFEAKDALVDDLNAAQVPHAHTRHSSSSVLVSSSATVIINYEPFRIDVKRVDGSTAAIVNDQGLMHFESFIPKDRGEHMFRADWGDDVDTRDLWEERFNSHTDPKPHGPAAVGLDVFFPDANIISGLPSRTVSLNLPATRGSGISGKEPYRMFNLDVFEYALNHAMGLYGAIPFVFALDSSHARASGGLWLNAAETFVDIEERDGGRAAHFMSETGVVDMFISVGPSPANVMRQYSRLTGTQSLPPVFSLGYHQCRWNYRDEADVDHVHAKFDEHDIPVDVIWLDIEHTNGKRYFTWDSGFFPNPVAMQQRLANKGRKMVTIVDPHIKVDDGYSVYKEAKDAGFYVMRGSDKSQVANGHCWSGDSAYLDFSNPAVRQYWAKQFTVYPGSTEHLFTWNDMNEPSVFNGPEISMPRDNVHYGDVEHRENHNMYGFFMTMATYAGHLQAYPNRRPFILSRSFFAGSQRHVAIWTGDNDASWEHLQASIPMVLAHNMAGLPFAGADTGGFFRNPEAELLVRWYQTAAWHPFFRGHAHLETKRREPWLFGDENTYVADLARYILHHRLPQLDSVASHVLNAEVAFAPPSAVATTSCRICTLCFMKAA